MDSFEGETFIETQRDLYYSYSCKYIYLDFRRQKKYFFFNILTLICFQLHCGR